MKKLVLVTILISSSFFFGCSKDDDNVGKNNNCLNCGDMTICKIDNEPNKVKLTAYGTESIADILVKGKTFKDINCNNTLEMLGLETK